MKKIWLMVIALVMMTNVAWADIFNLEAPLKYTQEKQADGSYVITLSGNLCIPDGVLYVYHQDNMRGRNVRKYRAEPVTFTDDLKQWIVTPFTTEVGQVMYNLYSPTLNRWMGIPTCMLTLGEGLAYGNSYFDASVEHEGAWDRPGGVGIIITAAGIPVQYPVSINCDQGQLPATRPVATPPVRTVAPKPATKPCPTDGGVSKNSDSTIGANIKSPQAAAVGIGNAWTAGNVKIGQNNKGPIYAPNKQKVYAPQYKNGHVNKNNKAPVYNGASRQYNFFVVNTDGHKGVDPRSDCTRCHNQSVIDEDRRDAEAYEQWKKDSEQWRAWNKACQENPTSAKCKEGEPKPSKSKYK